MTGGQVVLSGMALIAGIPLGAWCMDRLSFLGGLAVVTGYAGVLVGVSYLLHVHGI